MADSVITINTQKFRKVKGVWVDQRKTPAPKDLIALLDKLSAAEAATAGPDAAKESKPALPVLPIAAKDFSTAKLESSINRLATIIEKMSKTIQKGISGTSGSKEKETSPAQRVYEPGKIPTLREAMKLNTKEFFKGTTNKYGEKESPGLLRTLAQRVFPVTTPFFAAKDRQRSAIGGELREYESTLQSNSNLSKKQINQKIAEKRKELENPKAIQIKPEPVAQRITKDTVKEVARMKAANPELTSSNALQQIRSKSATDTSSEKEREKTMVQGKSEFASPDLGTKIVAVKITEIDDSVLKKLKEIFGKKDDKDSPDDKEENKSESDDDGGGDSFFDKMRKRLLGGRGRGAGGRGGGGRGAGGRGGGGRGGGGAAPGPSAEQLLDKNGKPLSGAAKASREAKLAREAVSAAENTAEQAAKKPSAFSRISKIFSGNATSAAAEGAETAAEQAAKKPGVLSRIAGGAKYAKTGIGSLLRGGGLRGVLGLVGGAALGGVGLALAPSDVLAGETEVVKKINAGSPPYVGSPQQMRLQAEVEAAASNKVPAAKKPNVLSKLFGGGTAATEGVEQAAKKPNVLSKLFGGGAKAAEKAGVKAGAKAGAKTGAKVLGKSLFKSALKKIPGVGLVAGGIFAAGRALKGDFAGAGLELASGAAGTIPGIGTAASIGIDAALAAKDMGAFGGAPPGSPAEAAQGAPAAPPGSPAEAAQGAPAVPVKPKTPSKFASVAKALGKGALMATPFGAAALGAKAIGGLLKNNKNTAEMAKPTGVTEQTQALTATTKQVETAKQQKPAAGPTVINNNVSSPTNVSSSQGVIGGPTVADRGSLNLASF